MIVQLIVFGIVVAASLVAVFMLKRSEQKCTAPKPLKDSHQKSAQEMVNVRDVKDRFLYTKDNQVMMYIRISPISVDLLSDREKNSVTKTLTAELSSERSPIKFLAVSRPIDISPLISDYSQLMLSATAKQKELLRNEMMVMSNYALSGDVVERQFYLMIWTKLDENCERDLIKRAYDLTAKFEGSSIRCEILKSQDIVRLCNLINNPAYTHIEDCGYEATIPILNNLMEVSK